MYEKRIFLSPSGHGPCLGFRKPGQPYEWISYVEVWLTILVVVALLCDTFFWTERVRSSRWPSRHSGWAVVWFLKVARNTLEYFHPTDLRYKLNTTQRVLASVVQSHTYINQWMVPNNSPHGTWALCSWKHVYNKGCKIYWLRQRSVPITVSETNHTTCTVTCLVIRFVTVQSEKDWTGAVCLNEL